MAIIYTLLDNYEDALKKINFILSIPGTFSVNQLKLDPLYDIGNFTKDAILLLLTIIIWSIY
jgi:hypothetical protein